MSYDMKKFTLFDKGIKLVLKPSDLDEFDDDPDVLRAELSCGHVTDPQTLTDCCRVQLDDGRTEFRCPLCEEEWPYDEVRKLAKLTIQEQLSFEEKLGMNTVKKIVDFRECPGCGTLTERMSVSSLCVQCSVCTAKNRKTFEFCWQCVREWKGPAPRADRCGNVGCIISDQELLRDCPLVTLPSVGNVQCPAIRACPTCGVLIELGSERCKIMTCPNCNKEFCFVCLKPVHECLKTATDFTPCSVGVAPRQLISGLATFPNLW
ncbi:E3 ubiquitin-protein ligase RNF19B-like [Megalobrama amblycephala]|uniref:E3 ubiquitin-protein ligase RNF19B-like n=1 Tax=Megalobrama amblycephala TaxID=75352 RepID=UPI0020141CF3|nr:E3 ubiquitin-protein ligase RNF19B-like [Megalobrama amblycephala]